MLAIKETESRRQWIQTPQLLPGLAPVAAGEQGVRWIRGRLLEELSEPVDRASEHVDIPEAADRRRYLNAVPSRRPIATHPKAGHLLIGIVVAETGAPCHSRSPRPAG